MNKHDYTKLTELLSKEKYPHKHLHKFIGINSKRFKMGVQALQNAFPKAELIAERKSNAKDGGNYLAITFELEASSPQDIIDFYRATSLIDDLKVIL